MSSDNAASPHLDPVAAWLRKCEAPCLAVKAPRDAPDLRELVVKLGEAAERGDVAQGRLLAQAATALAASRGWPHLAAGVQAVLAGIYTSARAPREALRCYAEVDRFGRDTYARGEATAHAREDAAEHGADTQAPDASEDGAGQLTGEEAKAYGLRLRRDAHLGQGANFSVERAWNKGARAFLDASSFSAQLGEPSGQLDGLRLAAGCYEQWGKLNQAWQCGLRALMVGSAMDPQTRSTSTLAQLGKCMLRIARSSSVPRASARDMEEQMVELLGPDWEQYAAPGQEAVAVPNRP